MINVREQESAFLTSKVSKCTPIPLLRGTENQEDRRRARDWRQEELGGLEARIGIDLELFDGRERSGAGRRNPERSEGSADQADFVIRVVPQW